MEYKGKIYGKVGNIHFPLEVTTDDWDSMLKRINELEAENKALRQKNDSFPYPDFIMDVQDEAYNLALDDLINELEKSSLPVQTKEVISQTAQMLKK